MAFGMLYRRLMDGRDDTERIKADAWLGMPGADERLAETRMAAVADAGFEVG